jgi:myosin-5
MQWVNWCEELDAHMKQLQAAVSIAEFEILRCDEVFKAKEKTILKLMEDLMCQATQLEMQQKTIDNAPVQAAEDGSIIMTLKNEVSNL